MQTSSGETSAFESVWNLVTAPFVGRANSLHGPGHWRRVERNGLLLATQTGANLSVVQLFALFHDSRRLNDGWDPGHGARGAEFAASLRGTAFELTDDEFAQLHYACVWHTKGRAHTDATIATCWDADRLDLGRVGITPNPKRMCTDFGRTIAAAGSIEPFLQNTTVSNHTAWRQ
jgi:uncharacterized protein